MTNETNLAKLITFASRMTRQANHCQTLNAKGLGMPLQNVAGSEENKLKARQAIIRARKIRLTRELTAETFAHGWTAKASDLNEKLVSLR
jgi:hypothetical protein